jgi:flagellar FliJ protein
MKKFNFSLQKVLEYNGHIQNRETIVLKNMQLNYKELCSDMDALLQRYESYKDEYSCKCTNGIIVNKVINLKLFISELQTQIKILSKKIEFAKSEIEKQIQKVVSVTQEKTSIEKLKDKHYETFKSQERKEDEIFINEFIMNSTSSQS